jgi:hypothetical protein
MVSPAGYAGLAARAYFTFDAPEDLDELADGSTRVEMTAPVALHGRVYFLTIHDAPVFPPDFEGTPVSELLDLAVDAAPPGGLEAVGFGGEQDPMRVSTLAALMLAQQLEAQGVATWTLYEAEWGDGADLVAGAEVGR